MQTGPCPQRPLFLSPAGALLLVQSVLALLASPRVDSGEAPGRPKTGKAWADMDYGPFLSASIEAPQPATNIAFKGIAIRLADAFGGQHNEAVVFDTDLLRYSAGWTGGFVALKGVVFDGEHWAYPQIDGEQVFGNPPLPGWAKDGVFKDPRPFIYGPLPREWAHWKGLYLHDQQVVLAYAVGETQVLERPGLARAEDLTAFTRTLNLSPFDRDLTLQIGFEADRVSRLLDLNDLNPADSERAASGTLVVLDQPGRDGQGHLELRKPLDGEVARLGLAASNVPSVAHVHGLIEDVRVHARDLKEGELEGLAGPPPNASKLVATVVGAPETARWVTDARGHIRLRLAPTAEPTRLTVLLARLPEAAFSRFATMARQAPPPADLAPSTRGGPPRWPQALETRGRLGPDHGPYAMDTLTWPDDNPWGSWMRFGGFDFFRDPTRAAICTWSGDVWMVSGIDESLANLTWRRHATGLFQPLGLKILDDQVYVLGRDQITRLHDLNGDGEADFYENFNNDAMVTEHFHEFAMDLQSDAQGNLYYMKGARHARDALHPQHGTLIKVSRDGKRSEILAQGFRAPNGLEVAPDGQCYTTDQEGYWMPANRLNLIQPGGFHGNTWSWFPEGKPTNYVPPICWIHPRVDRSPATMTWVTSDRWGPLKDQLLSVSYGVGRIFLVLHETVDGVTQGGVVPLPLEFDTGIMRSRFNVGDGQLYVCGLYGWAGNKTTPGGFYRVRATPQPLRLPTALHVATNGLVLRFSVPLDPASAADPGNYSLERWNYRWTENYGSPDFKLDGEKGRDRVAIESIQVSTDGHTVFLRLTDMRPVMQMHLQLNLRCADGAPLQTYVHHSIHTVGHRAGSFWLGDAPVTVARTPDVTLGREARGLIQTLVPVNHRDTTGPDVRHARLLALQVPAGSPASSLLVPGPFLSTWEGFLKLDLSETCEFRAEGNGGVTATINGRIVLSPSTASPSLVSSGPVPLRAGLNRLRVEFESPARGASTCRVLWRSAQFGWEPIPPTAFAHDATDPRLVAGDSRRLGRQLFAESRCVKCHQPQTPLGLEALPELTADTPRLAELVAGYRPDWLARYLTNPALARAEVRMPSTLSGDPHQRMAAAADLVAFLGTLPTREARQRAEREFPGNLEDRGADLFQSLGCVACHHLPGDVLLPDEPRISLAHVRAKYRPAALADFLRNPSGAFRWTRMPDFKLTETEANSLAAFLTTRGDPPAPEDSIAVSGDPARGRERATSAGCANCHDLGLPPRQPAPPGLDQLKGRHWASGCLAESDAMRQAAPLFQFTREQLDALRGFLRHDVASLRLTVWPEFAEYHIQSLRCAACHERDDAKDLWSSLEVSGGTGQSEPANPYDDEEPKGQTIHRQRPPLTWAGDKLRPDWLEAFLAGQIPYKPRPKLVARMPAFPAFAAGLARGMAMQHGYEVDPPPLGAIEAPLATAGEALIRKGAFGCVDCHAVGAQPALAGADTVTINFAYIPQRLRKEYYDRYLQDPQRFLPGTMMPRFVGDDGKTGITTHFEGDARLQFEAIWNHLRTVPPPPQP